MAVNLKKGQKVDLTKGNPGLSKIMVGLGWDVNRYDGGHDFDLDASAFLLGANGKVANDSNFVFTATRLIRPARYGTAATTEPALGRATTRRFSLTLPRFRRTWRRLTSP